MTGEGVGGFLVDATDATFPGFIDQSQTVPVVVCLSASWNEQSQQLLPILERLASEYGGRFLLVRADVDAAPQVAQAFQAQSIPSVVALIGGRTAPLFSGSLPEPQVREVIEQVLQVAAENGVTGRLGSSAPEAEPEPELSPRHQEAFEAIERGDYPAAVTAYEAALAENPRDGVAEAGLAQVRLLQRLGGVDAAEVRQRAADSPDDVAAACAVADLDVTGGHIDDAFDRLLTLFPRADVEGKNELRERLVALFTVVGDGDPRVVAARARLTNLLF